MPSQIRGERSGMQVGSTTPYPEISTASVGDDVHCAQANPATSDRVRQDVLAAIECGERCNAGMLSAWEEFLNPSVITGEATMEGLPSNSRGMPHSRSNVKNERMDRNFGA